jgi:hypothetical protein
VRFFEKGNGCRGYGSPNPAEGNKTMPIFTDRMNAVPTQAMLFVEIAFIQSAAQK